MSTLNKKEIKKRLEIGNYSNPHKLVVSPILDFDKQVDTPGVDLRLSNQFIVFKLENITHLEARSINSQNIRKYQKHVVVPYNRSFILHPKTLVLSSTLEYVSIPTDLEGRLEGRSSWARLGLIIATACAIDPGFKGCITLELTNLGNQPLHLYPGVRIAKLILNETSSESTYDRDKKKYFCQIGPEFSQAHTDNDINIFK